MVGENVPSGKGDRPKARLLVACICIVAVVISAALLVIVANGDKGTGPISTSVQDMVLDEGDLPSGWKVAAPFQPFVQGYLPGNKTSAGGIGFNNTIAQANELYMISMLIKYATVEEAAAALEEIKSMTIATMGDWTNGTIGDGSIMGDYNYFDYKIGKAIWFQERNVLCTMQYYAFTNVPGEVTDEMMIEMANLQLAKIR